MSCGQDILKVNVDFSVVSDKISLNLNTAARDKLTSLNKLTTKSSRFICD
jgi:hypothetical protein